MSSSKSATKGQRSIVGFFQKKTTILPSHSPNGHREDSSPSTAPNGMARGIKVASRGRKNQGLTPAPSSDALEGVELSGTRDTGSGRNSLAKQLPSPVTPTVKGNGLRGEMIATASSAASSLGSPTRKGKRAINYAESDDEDSAEEDVFPPPRANRRKALKRQRVVHEDDSDDFVNDGDLGQLDDDMEDFIVPDDSDEEPQPKKSRKRAAKAREKSPALTPTSPAVEALLDPEERSESTARQWTYDPANPQPLQPRSAAAVNAMTKRAPTDGKRPKLKAHTSEPEQRYPWLAKITDLDRNPPGHADYDPRTVYIPPLAWDKFSPFEKQYWEIKQKLWDTIVFFKKGKFYELYENDATIGHQLFDFKLTDRVNMRMVGVPESSLGHWVSQFVAKGFKVARVDQSETALGKEMRERNGKPGAKSGGPDKIIRRELSQVLTGGTLVDGSMLQDDFSTYCVAIKEATVAGLPAFGAAFVDTATGEFNLAEFHDDADMTKLETFVAQIRPQELLLEKSCISVKALRILKNNTGPTTIWNHLKSGQEFWTADIARRDLDASAYFTSEDRDDVEAWPGVLREARSKELLMSAFGALLHYLRTLKIERDLITQGNFNWYDPIQKATSLVLDGQTLINLEIFANTVDGGMTGTLCSLLNRCITPFGKRMFRQWVCHPLVDPDRVNARLDAVDSLNADTAVLDRFTSQLTRLPDLERMTSRIHAGSCKAQDFLRVLEGFEQVDFTMGSLADVGSGDGVVGQLVASMPDLRSSLDRWKSAFDRIKAKDDGLLVPERGVETDFDESQDRIEQILAGLDSLLKKYRRDLGSTAIVYRDNGKEIYQLEVPTKVKNVPKNWDQMSATQKVKRYYSPELRALVRKLQEAQETHAQIVKEVGGRFFARFAEDNAIWLAAIKIVAQLDCLISLAKASTNLGEPRCRPEFVDGDRSVLEFEELRHPCMLPTVSDFIPNDVVLGGETANMTLLTGANAAGKSTILRMTCVAVIMAQIGCYVPCTSARMTPVDRIMSRLGANDNIFAAQSTFFVELSETKKILSEATPRSLVILDELGRGTSSYDGVAVAQAVLHHVATHIGCMGFFATHYHSLAAEFEGHPEIASKRMQIHVDDENRRVTFLYKLEDGVAEGSFGMHCAAMCGIPSKVIDRAEIAAKEWEHTSRLKSSLEKARTACYIPLGLQSDVAWALKGAHGADDRALQVLMKAIDAL
ncbi:MAG: DNA mismatch repair protein msh6 [Lichina confinis]|nr:MAG: DNA mismatch repair protein msh6 [Lichina confinis]